MPWAEEVGLKNIENGISNLGHFAKDTTDDSRSLTELFSPKNQSIDKIFRLDICEDFEKYKKLNSLTI